MSLSKREFHNRFPYTNVERIKLLEENGKLGEDISKEIKSTIEKLLEQMYKGLKSIRNEDDSIYTGQSGISLLNLHLYKILDEEKDGKYLHTALQFLEKPLHQLKNKRYTFLCGDAGPLALGAVIYHKLKDDSMSKECIKRLEDLHYPVCKDLDIPNELLYGRVGYIYSLLFVQKHLGPESITSTIIPKFRSKTGFPRVIAFSRVTNTLLSDLQNSK